MVVLGSKDKHVKRPLFQDQTEAEGTEEKGREL
jgi:hypothetical protein